VTNDTPAPPEYGKLAYDEAVRSIESQEGVVDNLRTRAGTVLAAASLVTSFLGGQVLAQPVLANGVVVRPEIETPGWIAIGAFVLLAVLSLWILWPRKWRFETSAEQILKQLEGKTEPLDTIYGQLAAFKDQDRRTNRSKLVWLFRLFQLACLLLVVETVAWIVDLGDVAIPGDIPGF
jgi:hypothetical protein